MFSRRIHVVSRAVVMDHDHILLCKTVRYNKNFYFFPGGHVEYNESAEQAVVREMHEELGLQWCVKRFLGCLEYSFVPENPDKCHTHEYNMFFELQHNSLSFDKPVVAKEEHIAFEWIALDTIQMIDLRPDPLKKILHGWISANLHQALASSMVSGAVLQAK